MQSTMRTPKQHISVDGEESWYVRYRRYDVRKQKNVETTETFDDEDSAWHFSKLMALVGADRALAMIEQEALGGGASDAPTLDQWFNEWVESKTGIEEGTREDYRRMYKRQWQPRLGHIPLDMLTRQAAGKALNEFASAGNAGKPYRDHTVANYHGFISSALDDAVKAKKAPENPFKGMPLPRHTEHETEEMCFLLHDEFWMIHDEIRVHWRPLIVTFVGTGIRWGEAAATLVGDVDLDATVVRNGVAYPAPFMRVFKGVKHHVKAAKRRIGPPKTKKSRRTILLPPEVVEVLRPLVKDRPASAPLFTAPQGGKILHQRFWSDAWRPALFAAQHCDKHVKPECRCGTTRPERCPLHKGTLPEPCGCAGTLTKTPRIHDLRHTHASWLIAQGIQLPAIQARLGHEKITTTIDTYGHLLPDLQIAAAHAASVALTLPAAINWNAASEEAETVFEDAAELANKALKLPHAELDVAAAGAAEGDVVPGDGDGAAAGELDD